MTFVYVDDGIMESLTPNQPYVGVALIMDFWTPGQLTQFDLFLKLPSWGQFLHIQ